MRACNKEDDIMKKVCLIIKKILNDISYDLWSTRIMSDAMEYDLDPQIVEAMLDANYKNHYDN